VATSIRYEVIMLALRNCLLALNAACVLMLISALRIGPHQAEWFALAYGTIICLALNFIYLSWSYPDDMPMWQVFRLLGRWFETKANELRKLFAWLRAAR
jgi:hypothetical protein